MKVVVLTGIDSTGKSTMMAQLPWKNTRKYPNNKEIKEQINNLYQILANDNTLHDSTVHNIYRQIHDLYDRDFRIDYTVPTGEPVLIFDRYFIDNVVYSRMNGVEKGSYSEDHHYIPDLVIMLKARNYPVWREKFVLKGDENIREPAILFQEVQKELQAVLRELQESKKIKKYTIIEGLCEDTQEKIVQTISDLLSSSHS
jgi:thymidylate kinase